MWQDIAKAMNVPWRAAELWHWQLASKRKLPAGKTSVKRQKLEDRHTAQSVLGREGRVQGMHHKYKLRHY